MKKILLIILLFAGLITKAQYPNTITGGNSSTLNKQLGGYGASLGFVFTSYFSDTTAANLLFIKNVPGHVIRVVNDLWMRNTDANTWVKIGSAGGGTDNTNLGSFYRLLVPSSQGIKGIAPGYGTLWDSTTNANSLTSKVDTFSVATRAFRDKLKDSLAAVIATKLNLSDTANKWVNNITRTPGKDSIIFYVGATRYAIKDSTGTGGGFDSTSKIVWRILLEGQSNNMGVGFVLD